MMNDNWIMPLEVELMEVPDSMENVRGERIHHKHYREYQNVDLTTKDFNSLLLCKIYSKKDGYKSKYEVLSQATKEYTEAIDHGLSPGFLREMICFKQAIKGRTNSIMYGDGYVVIPMYMYKRIKKNNIH